MYNRLVNPLNLELLNQAKNILVLETKFSNQFCFLLNNLRKLCLGQNFQDLKSNFKKHNRQATFRKSQNEGNRIFVVKSMLIQ